MKREYKNFEEFILKYNQWLVEQYRSNLEEQEEYENDWNPIEKYTNWYEAHPSPEDVYGRDELLGRNDDWRDDTRSDEDLEINDNIQSIVNENE